MSKQKKTAIVTGGTKNQFPAMAVLALNIADKCPDIADELVIFHDGVSKEEQKKVNGIFPTRFIEYKSPFSGNTDFEETVKNYFSLMVFCKYECWNLLDEYKTVVWTDYDIVFIKNISEIAIKNNNYCSFIKDHILIKKFNYSLFWEYEDQAKKLPLFSNGICACLFVLHDDFPNYLDFYKSCLEKTKNYCKALYLPEEAVISILFHEKNIKYNELQSKIYALQPQNDKIDDSTKGIHSCGQPKFWNGLNNEQWNLYYNKWISEYNGQAFEINKHKINVILKKLIKFILPYGIIRLYQRKKYGK